MLKFGFLSTVDSPLLPFCISAAQQSGVENIIVICDSKTEDDKSRKIWKERTGTAFDAKGEMPAGIYRLDSKPVPFYFVESHNSKKFQNLVEVLNISCLLNVYTPRKISSDLIRLMRNGIVNIHPGVLPEYRGCTAVEWAILNDEKVGNTAHFMDEGYDTGPIIRSETYEFSLGDDYQSIRTQVYKSGCILAGQVLASIQDSDLRPRDAKVQNHDKAKYWRPIPDDKMQTMLRKLKSNTYKYQSA